MNLENCRIWIAIIWSNWINDIFSYSSVFPVKYLFQTNFFCSSGPSQNVWQKQMTFSKDNSCHWNWLGMQNVTVKTKALILVLDMTKPWGSALLQYSWEGRDAVEEKKGKEVFPFIEPNFSGFCFLMPMGLGSNWCHQSSLCYFLFSSSKFGSSGRNEIYVHHNWRVGGLDLTSFWLSRD